MLKIQKQLQNHLKLTIQSIQLLWVIYIKYFIDNNNIGGEGAKAIAKLIKINNSINSITLGNL